MVKLPELGSRVVSDGKLWDVTDIQMCNGIGVNVTYVQGGSIYLHLKSPSGGETARYLASECRPFTGF